MRLSLLLVLSIAASPAFAQEKTLAFDDSVMRAIPTLAAVPPTDQELESADPGFDMAARFNRWQNAALPQSRLLSTERHGIVSYRTDGDRQWLYQGAEARDRALHANLPTEGRIRVWFPGIRSAVVIQNTFQGRPYVYLVDPGREEDADGLVHFLKTLGVKKIDAVLISHAHADHYGGLRAVLDAFPIRRLYLSGWLPSCSPNVVAFQAILRYAVFAKRVPFVPINEDTPDLGWPGLETRVLAPRTGFFESEEPACAPDGSVRVPGAGLNANSVVLRVSLGKRSVLLPGDATPETMRELVRRHGRELAADVLLAPHHGLDFDETFQRAVNPLITIINWDHPNDPERQHLAKH